MKTIIPLVITLFFVTVMAKSDPVIYPAPSRAHQIENVTFENLKILGNTISNAIDARFDTVSITNLFFINSTSRPVTNSLRMEFLPAGTSNVLVSRWETRVKDFAAFVKATGYDAFSESTDGKRPFTLEANALNASGYDWKQSDGSWQDPHIQHL